MAERLETKRLSMRKMTQEDYGDLCKMLQDKEVMYAYEGPFDEEGVQDWLDCQLARYEESGFGLYAVIEKETGEMIGQCGLTIQELPEKKVLEVGYLFRKKYWHQGYAIEAAKAWKEYAFDALGAEEVYSIIRDSNLASKKVAQRNKMTCIGSIVKHYRGVVMPHDVYCAKREDERCAQD